MLSDNFRLLSGWRLRAESCRAQLASGRLPASNPDQTIADLRAQIAANEGRNDTTVPLMWFAPTATGEWEASGRLAAFSRRIPRPAETGARDLATAVGR